MKLHNETTVTKEREKAKITREHPIVNTTRQETAGEPFDDDDFGGGGSDDDFQSGPIEGPIIFDEPPMSPQDDTELPPPQSPDQEEGAEEFAENEPNPWNE